MPGSITPLPIMQLEEEEDRKRYAELEPPKSIVVRYGYLKHIAELPYDGKDKPGCGSKLVIMTRRGIELGEMLTTTCGNSGCGKSVSRKQMLQYIENSGGKDFPFSNQGKVLRVATLEDLQEQERLEKQKMPMIRFTKALVTELGLPMKLVDIEWLLGGERIIFHYISESWVDFRELVKQLAAEYQTRIEMHQVNARDEARLVADYEKCGQHCCCKQFLKVLKPVSMRSAKVQKATLDPTKISGRCGRLMCCLRYEDETYEDLRKRLPHRQTRVQTVDGVGTVIDSQILTQLVLVVLDTGEPPAAYPLENIEILTKDHPQFRKPEPQQPPPMRSEGGRRNGDRSGPPSGQPQNRRGPAPQPPQRDDPPQDAIAQNEQPPQENIAATDEPSAESPDRQPRDPRPEQQGQRPPRDPNRQRSEGGGERKGDRGRRQRGEGRGDNRNESGRGGEGRGDNRGDDRGPRRPRPGQPLQDNEVESREGTRPAIPGDAPPFASQERPSIQPPLDQDDDQDDDGPDDAGNDSQASADGDGQPQGEDAPRKRRRRRRRRGRGGQGGPNTPGSTPGTPPPPTPSGE